MRLNHGVAVLTAACVALAARAAVAQTRDYPVSPPAHSDQNRSSLSQDRNPLLAPERPDAWTPQSQYGIGLLAGGGISSFTNSATEDHTGVAGVWNLRAVFGTRTYVGVEGAYVGAAQSISGLGSDTGGTLIRTGFEGTIRLNLPLEAYGGLLEPYIFGGLGWDHYGMSNIPVTTADVNQTDNTMTVPAGAGFSVIYKGFIADARFTYKPTYFTNLFTGSISSGLTNWILGAQLGYEL